MNSNYMLCEGIHESSSLRESTLKSSLIKSNSELSLSMLNDIEKRIVIHYGRSNLNQFPKMLNNQIKCLKNKNILLRLYVNLYK